MRNSAHLNPERHRYRIASTSCHLELNAVDDSLNRTYTWGLDLAGHLDWADSPMVSFRGTGGVGALLAVNFPAGASQFYVYDGNGNVKKLIGDTGWVFGEYDYGPYGETTAVRSYTDNTYCFSTKFLETSLAWPGVDPGVQIYDYGFRWYNAGLGRWVSRDPIGERGGHNLFRFVGNPLSENDLHGLVMSRAEVIIGWEVEDTMRSYTWDFNIMETSFRFYKPEVRITSWLEGIDSTIQWVGGVHKFTGLIRHNRGMHYERAIHYPLEGYWSPGHWGERIGAEIPITDQKGVEVQYKPEGVPISRAGIMGETTPPLFDDMAREVTFEDGKVVNYCTQCLYTEMELTVFELQSRYGDIPEVGNTTTITFLLAGASRISLPVAAGAAVVDSFINMTNTSFFTISRNVRSYHVVCADGEAWTMIYNLPYPFHVGPDWRGREKAYTWWGTLIPGGDFQASGVYDTNPPNVQGVMSYE